MCDRTRRQVLQYAALGGMVGLAGCDSLPGTSTTESTPTGGPSQVQKLAPEDADSGDLFGGVVELSGDTALFGMPADNTEGGTNAGSAYVFSRTDGSWQQEAELVPDDGNEEDLFGSAVALGTDTALVGARRDGDQHGYDTGSVYAFSRANGSWRQEAKFVPEDGGNQFGYDIALEGDTALVITGQNHEVYEFRRSGGSWTERSKVALDRESSTPIFTTVELSGDTAVVGTGGEDSENGEVTGSAYVFSRANGSWQQEARLLPDDGHRLDEFGEAVALDGDVALIGAKNVDTSQAENAGAAYVFTRSGGSWEQTTKLVADDGEQYDGFGTAVALGEDVTFVGAPTDHNDNGGDAGTVYVFSRADDSWSREAELIADDGDESDRFGESVAVDGDTLVAGANTDEDPNGRRGGSAYVFELSQ